MSWTNKPPMNGDDIQQWSWLIEFWYALRERAAVLNNSWQWPPPNEVWASGTISGTPEVQPDGTLTFSMDGVTWDDLCDDETQRWVDYVCGGDCPPRYLPSTYDLIIEGDRNDPFTAVRGKIIAQNYTGPGPTNGSLTVDSQAIKDALTANFIPSLVSLAGQNFYILKHGGLWCSDRLPDKPNDQEEWAGSDSVSGMTFNLSVSATDETEDSTLNYRWAATGPGTVEYSVNDSYEAASPIAAVTIPGLYLFTVTITDIDGLSATSQVNVQVTRDAFGVTIDPSSPGDPAPDPGGPTIASSASATSNGLMTWKGGSTTYTTITDQSFGACESWPRSAPWSVDQWASGYEVLTYGSDNALHRETIQHNHGATLFINPTSYKPGGQYLIVAAGAKAMPGRLPWKPFQWYAGYAANGAAHMADDSIGSWPVAQAFAYWMSGDPCPGGTGCTESSNQAFDTDPYVPFDSEGACEGAGADRYLAPNMWKTIRALQNYIVSICGGFVAPIDYDGALAIPTFTPATFFKQINVNWDAGFLVHVSGSAYTFNVSSEYIGVPIYYTVINADGSNGPSASGVTSDDSGVITGITDASDGSSAGLQAVYSAGWTRYRPLWFRYMYPKTVFIPSTTITTHEEGDSTESIWDPPRVLQEVDEDGSPIFDAEGNPIYNCSTVGSWQQRPASTKYVVRGLYGQISDGSVLFQDGDLARYIGDTAEAGIYGSSDPLLVPYYDHFFRGNYASPAAAERANSRSGTVTAYRDGMFTDSTKNWWGTLNDSADQGKFTTDNTQSTATGGSTTSLLDASKDITVDTHEWKCWWDSSRFNLGFATDIAYQSFILEVDQNYAGTDLTVDSVNHLKVTSASHSFSINDIGSTINVTAGTGWTAGAYVIFDVDSGAALLYSSPLAPPTVPPTTVGSATWNESTTYRVPITSTSGTADAITINFEAIDNWDGPISGNSYRIFEPKYELNKWQNRSVKFMRPDGSTFDLVARLSDDQSIYFDPDSIVQGDGDEDDHSGDDWVGYSYEIVEPAFGGVWKWSATQNAWTIPTGSDAARIGVTDSPNNFQQDQTSNLETYLKDYGPVMAYDVISTKLFEEMYAAVNALYVTIQGFSWTSRQDLVTPTVNSNHALNYVYPYASSVNAAWATVIPQTPSENNGGAPYNSSILQTEVTATNISTGQTTYRVGDLIEGGAEQAYGYLNAFTGVPATVLFYTYGSLDSEDTAPITGEPNLGSDGVIMIRVEKFDAHGMAVSYHQWKSWCSVSNSVSPVISTKLGDDTFLYPPSGLGPQDTSDAGDFYGYREVVVSGANYQWWPLKTAAVIFWQFDYHG